MLCLGFFVVADPGPFMSFIINIAKISSFLSRQCYILQPNPNPHSSSDATTMQPQTPLS